MFFSYTPAYHDPSNWHQQPNHQVGASSTQTISTQLLPPPPPQPHGGAGSIRPGSMAERARLANIPIPEAALKCPRCESTNTKFCYFNNYCLTQPRHFCKTCRRYWTSGGALRNVPVGGGCRRNKRSKGNSSHKSPVSGGSSSNIVSSNGGILSNLGPQVPPLRFMAPSDHSHLGFSYGSVLSNPVGEASGQLNFQMGSGLASSVGGGSLLALGALDRFQQGQQFPFFSGLDSSAFESGLEPSSFVGGLTMPKLSSSGAIQMGSVKMEEESQETNLSRQFSGINHGNDQCWNTGSGWTDLSSFRSSSSSNPL